jgi:hypothetical protein
MPRQSPVTIMAKLTVDLPDSLWDRMRTLSDADWSAVAARAFEMHLDARGLDGNKPGSAIVDRLRASKGRYIRTQRSAGYGSGYAWARDRAEYSDLQAMIEAPSYAAAVDVVRNSRRFSERDEFGDALRPSDEMWEAFVDGATALYHDVEGRI